MSSGIDIKVGEGGSFEVGGDFAGNDINKTTTYESTPEVIGAVETLVEELKKNDPLLSQAFEKIMQEFDARGRFIQELRTEVRVLYKEIKDLNTAILVANNNYALVLAREKELRRRCNISLLLKVAVFICAFVCTLLLGAGLWAVVR